MENGNGDVWGKFNKAFGKGDSNNVAGWGPSKYSEGNPGTPSDPTKDVHIENVPNEGGTTTTFFTPEQTRPKLK